MAGPGADVASGAGPAPPAPCEGGAGPRVSKGPGHEPTELLPPDGTPAVWQRELGAEPAFSRQRARTLVAEPREPNRVEAGVEWPPTS